ncbi:MAG TPA: TadE/TadG family type IV pilus assembly protein, partial [Sphingomonas sp.]|nr:TadE/TadG family type IV pilus assembly protein [Sphingomonas sp.]
MAMRDHLRAKAKAAGLLARRLARLRGDSRGASIVEFAIVAAPFLALLIAIVETSLVFFAQQGLETTAEY